MGTASSSWHHGDFSLLERNSSPGILRGRANLEAMSGEEFVIFLR